MSATLPPIYRDCRRLLVHTEEVVRRFSRYNKYTVGTDLRQQAMLLMRGVHKTVYDRANQEKHVNALLWRVDDYKLTLQLAIELGAFATQRTAGFSAFETAAQLAAAIGKQCGGWQKKIASSPSNTGGEAMRDRESQATGTQVPAKSATDQRAQVGQALQPSAKLHPAVAAGQQPQASPAACPASLSALAAQACQTRTPGAPPAQARAQVAAAPVCSTQGDMP